MHRLALTPPTLSPFDLTKVRQGLGQQVHGRGHQEDLPHCGRAWASGTWLRQMSYSMCHFWVYNESKKLLGVGKDTPVWKLVLAGTPPGSMAGGIEGFVGNPGEIIMARLQGDFAKPPEKRFNYKNCFDALFHMVCEEGPSSFARGIGPNVFRAILMNASQLASYDFFKAELLKTRYFKDNIMCHFTVSFTMGTVATTVCSPRCAQEPHHERLWPRLQLDAQHHPHVVPDRRRDVHVQGLGACVDLLQPTTILIFLTLEQLKNRVDWMRGRGIEVL
ncbi:mitochondrial carrier domain-containing protein [Mycena leptocephala]|nr:mitochondrial carrier domain-containing protein [Mycena leptocephala]